MNTQSKFDKFSDKLAKVSGYLSNHKQLAGIRDAFATFLPLLIAGSLAVLIDSVFLSPTGMIGSWANAGEGWFKFYEYIGPLFTSIDKATFAIFSIHFSFLIGYFHTGAYTGYDKNKQMFGGLISLATFFLLLPFSAGEAYAQGNPDTFPEWMNAYRYYLGSNGLFVALIFGLLSSYIFAKFLTIDKMKIKLPDAVPPAIASAFNQIIPIGLSLFSVSFIQFSWMAIARGVGWAGEPQHYIFGAIQTAIAAPLSKMGDSAFFILTLSFLMGFLFFFGVHGPNVLAAVRDPIYLTKTTENIELYSEYGQDIVNAGATGIDGQVLNTWTTASFDMWGQVGGTGATLALIIVIFFVSKSVMHKRIVGLSVAPGIFNINETMIFGMPLMTNVKYFIPFVFSGPILNGIGYIFAANWIVNPAVFLVPWTTPFGVNAILSTLDPMVLIPIAIILVTIIALYLPFVILDMKTMKKEFVLEGKNNSEINELIDKTTQFEDLISKIKHKPTKPSNKTIKLDNEIDKEIKEKTKKGKEEFLDKNTSKSKKSTAKKPRSKSKK